MWWVLILVIAFFCLYGVTGLFSDLESWFLKTEGKDQPIIIGKANAENREWVERRLCYIARKNSALPVLVSDLPKGKTPACDHILYLTENELARLKELL